MSALFVIYHLQYHLLWQNMSNFCILKMKALKTMKHLFLVQIGHVTAHTNKNECTYNCSHVLNIYSSSLNKPPNTAANVGYSHCKPILAQRQLQVH